MKRIFSSRFIAAAVLAGAALGAVSTAQARPDVEVSIGLGRLPGLPAFLPSPPVPVPVFTRPSPVYVEPAPVYVQPRPVYVQPRPVYAPPPVVVYERPAWGPGYGHEFERERAWRHAEWQRREWEHRHHGWDRDQPHDRHGRR